MYKIDESRVRGYKKYHADMMRIGDCDPAYPAMRYLVDRFELNTEQKYWLAFLYQATYCVPTVYYIYSEFPDYENVDTRRLQSWWTANKKRLLFQTDRAKVRNFDKFVPMFESYRDLIGDCQAAAFDKLKRDTVVETYDTVFEFCGQIYYIGRYSLFLYLECLHRLTDYPMLPSGLELRTAESCRNGLCYALGLDSWVGENLTALQYKQLQGNLADVVSDLRAEHRELPISYWNIETSLCAYKKLHQKKRYLGYYIDRQQEEIATMEANIPFGVDWQVLWNFRTEYFHHKYLGELHGRQGVRPELYGLPNKWLQTFPGEFKDCVKFRGKDLAYV